VLIDFVSWHTAMLVDRCGLALIAATVAFGKCLPESRNFRARSLHPRSLLDGFTSAFS
jgi:YNFM family putative membrane transporter